MDDIPLPEDIPVPQNNTLSCAPLDETIPELTLNVVGDQQIPDDVIDNVIDEKTNDSVDGANTSGMEIQESQDHVTEVGTEQSTNQDGKISTEENTDQFSFSERHEMLTSRADVPVPGMLLPHSTFLVVSF